MAKTIKANRYHIGRIGAPTNLRSGGAMESAGRKRNARRDRKAMRVALRRGDEV